MHVLNATKICEHCGKSFRVEAYRADKAKFCSRTCLWAGRARPAPTGVLLECAHCRQPFYVPSWRSEVARYCSSRCVGLAYSADKQPALLKANVTHGHTYTDQESKKKRKSPEYRAWEGMKNRCENQLWYVRHQIKVCSRWRYDFAAFLADMGPKPSAGHSLDRYPDAYGDYEPGNCRWATSDQQAWSKRGSKTSDQTRSKMREAFQHNAHQGRGGHQKLTIDQVRAIRALEGKEPRSSIAKRMNINIWHVRDIQKRRVWAWLK